MSVYILQMRGHGFVSSCIRRVTRPHPDFGTSHSALLLTRKQRILEAWYPRVRQTDRFKRGLQDIRFYYVPLLAEKEDALYTWFREFEEGKKYDVKAIKCFVTGDPAYSNPLKRICSEFVVVALETFGWHLFYHLNPECASPRDIDHATNKTPVHPPYELIRGML